MTALPLDIAVKASAVLAAAGLIQMFLRRRGSAAARHLVWAIAIAGLLALPLASVVVPSWAVAIPVAAASRPIVADGWAVSAKSVDPIGASLPASSSPAPAAQPALQNTPFEWIALTIALYGAGVLFLLARLAGQEVVLRRLTRKSRIVSDAAWQRLLEDAARQLHVRTAPLLFQSAIDIMPLTFGTRRPVVLLPGAADGWAEDRRRVVLLHELAHVVRCDCLTQRLAAIACAFYWPHPGVWWAARRLRIERELACDDRVLAAGTAAREYAGHLLDLAHSLRATPAPAAALGMARTRQLESRLLAVLDATRNRAGLQRRGRLVAIAASLMLLPVAALRASIVPPDRVAHPETGSTPERSLASQSTPTSASEEFSGTWEIRVAPNAGTVHLSLRTAHSSNGTTLPLARFEGLTAGQLSGAAGAVRFSSRREAGTFSFEGVCRNGLCGGTYTFALNPAFASELAKRGLGAPTAAEQYELALDDVGVAFVDGVKALGYAVPDVRAIVRAAAHGVSLEYVRAMADLGYRLGSLEALIRLRDHGVDPDFVRGMAAAGFSRLTAEQLVRTRDHGVDPPYVKGMRDLGYGSAGLEDLITARDHGVDPKFASDVAALGYKSLTLDALVGARDHGVDSGYIRAMQGFGYRLTLSELTQARDHGVDPAYVDGLVALGYTNVSLDALRRLRDHGVDPAYVKAMAALGYKDLPPDALVRLRDHGVDAAYVQRLQQRGIHHLSVDDLIRRRDRGDDDPGAMARSALESLWRSIVSCLRG